MSDARARHLELLKLAPEGTCGILVYDFEQIASSPAVDQIPRPMFGLPGGSRLMVEFFLPRPATEWAGIQAVPGSVIKTKGVPRHRLEETLSRMGRELTISGAKCYDVSDMGLVAVVDDSTILTGADQTSLGTMLAARAGGGEKGMEAALWELVEPLAGSGAYVAAVLPTELRNMLDPELRSLFPIPPVLQGMRAFTLGVRLDAGFELAGMLSLGSSDDAEQAAQAGMAQIKSLGTTLREEMRVAPASEVFFGQEIGLLDKIELAAQGKEVRGRLAVTRDELAELKGNWLGWLTHRLILAPAFEPEVYRPATELPPRERQLELLKLAPKGTWAVHVRDFARTRNETNHSLGARGALPRFPGTVAQVRFHLKPEGEVDDVPSCCVTRLEGMSVYDMVHALKRVSETLDVEGMNAYAMRDGPFVAFADEDTMLTSRTKDALAEILRAYCDPACRGMEPDLRRLVEPFVGSADYSCGLAPSTVRDPEWTIFGILPVEGCLGGTLDIDRTHGYSVKASLMTASPEAAAERAEEARSFVRSVIDEFRQRSEEAPRAAEAVLAEIAVLQHIRILAEGDEVRVELDISEDEEARLPEYWWNDLYKALIFQYGSVSFVRTSAVRDDTRYRLREVGEMLALYGTDHGVPYPDSLAPVVDAGYFPDTEFFVQASDGRGLLAWLGGTLWSYRYVGWIAPRTPRSTIIMYMSRGMFSGGRNVLCAGGRVAWVTEAELQDPDGPPSTSLRASYRAVVEAFGEELTPERNAELRRFYEMDD